MTPVFWASAALILGYAFVAGALGANTAASRGAWWEYLASLLWLPFMLVMGLLITYAFARDAVCGAVRGMRETARRVKGERS